MPDNMQDRGARLGEAADQATSTVTEMAGRAKEAVGQYAGQAKEYAQKGYRYAAEKAGQVKGSTEHYITENPWYAVGIAVGVGVLLGMLIRGSRSSD